MRRPARPLLVTTLALLPLLAGCDEEFEGELPPSVIGRLCVAGTALAAGDPLAAFDCDEDGVCRLDRAGVIAGPDAQPGAPWLLGGCGPDEALPAVIELQDGEDTWWFGYAFETEDGTDWTPDVRLTGGAEGEVVAAFDTGGSAGAQAFALNEAGVLDLAFVAPGGGLLTSEDVQGMQVLLGGLVGPVETTECGRRRAYTAVFVGDTVIEVPMGGEAVFFLRGLAMNARVNMAWGVADWTCTDPYAPFAWMVWRGEPRRPF